MLGKDVHTASGAGTMQVGAGTRPKREKLVERIGALCATQRNKKRKKRRKA